MKRFVLLCLIIGVIACPVLSMASPEIIIGDIPTYEVITHKQDIVPTVTIHDPGTIAVTISWITPVLTFEKRARGSIDYYALKNNASVIFNIKNQSIKSSGNEFNGDISITPQFDWSEGLANNISVTMTKQGTPVAITYTKTDDSVTLKYAPNPSFENAYLDFSLTTEQISTIMTMHVTFVIKKL